MFCLFLFSILVDWVSTELFSGFLLPPFLPTDFNDTSRLNLQVIRAKNGRFEFNLNEITRLVPAIKSLRFALLVINVEWFQLILIKEANIATGIVSI